MALDFLKDKSIRVFLALPLAPLFQTHVEPLISQGRKRFPSIRWANPAEIHLTLHFFGSIDLKSIENINRAVEPLVSNTKELTVYLSGLGGFPNLRRPRVVWLGIQGEINRLECLRSEIEEKLGKIGFPSEKRDFLPHLTLARIKVQQGDLNLKTLIFKNTPARPVKEIVLFQSHLGPLGARYETIKTFPFAN